jgi:uncharacterized protein YdhG (YjbR/CyaY superfamily)
MHDLDAGRDRGVVRRADVVVDEDGHVGVHVDRRVGGPAEIFCATVGGRREHRPTDRRGHAALEAQDPRSGRSWQDRHPPRERQHPDADRDDEEDLTVPTKKSQTAEGFTAEERAAMKERAAELRAEGRKGAKKADGLQAVLDRIAGMAPEDRVLAERVHATVTAAAPDLSPKTWYGMPAYANAAGKVVIFFQDAGKFGSRYSSLGFNDDAALDDGDMWPVSYAVKRWSPTVEKKVAELVRSAIS